MSKIHLLAKFFAFALTWTASTHLWAAGPITFDFEPSVPNGLSNTYFQTKASETLLINATKTLSNADTCADHPLNGSGSLFLGCFNLDESAVTFSLQSGNKFNLTGIRWGDSFGVNASLTLTSSKGNLAPIFPGYPPVFQGLNDAKLQGITSFTITGTSDLGANKFVIGIDDIVLDQIFANLCSPGSYSATGIPPCTTAPAGTYVSGTGATLATSCAAGTYNPSTGSISSAACQATPAGSYSLPGASSASTCPAGTYNPFTGSSGCTTTPAGYYSSAGASSASTCPAGTYNPFIASSSCTTTPAGYYSYSGASSPTICSAGTFSVGGSSGCTPTPAGYYSTAGSSGFTACAPGTFNPNTGGTSSAACQVTPAGSYSIAGASSATACIAGTYNPNTGGTSTAACQATPAGYYSNPGATSPTACTAGTYNPTTSSNSAASCLPTPAGSYSIAGASSATACTAGTYNPNTGGTSAAACSTAPAGSFSSPGASSATSCAAGYFSSNAGSSSCTAAPAGSYVAAGGATVSTVCAAGTYSSGTANVSCTAAPAGSFVSNVGASSATLCSPGYFSSTAGSSACTISPANFFVSTSGATVATPCAANTSSAPGSTSCATIVNGTCGALANVASTFMPNGAGLCTAGTASGVTSGSPWTWSCAGANTGSTAQCAAPTGVTATSSGSTRAVVTGTNWVVSNTVVGGVPATAGAIGVSGNAKSPGSMPPNVQFPHGLFDFTLAGGAGPVTVELTYPTPLPAGTVYWKYGKTSANSPPTWYQFAGAVISNDRMSITLTLTDGALGDDDGVVNGVITDPGGPGVPGGTDAVGVPTLTTWGLLLLLGAMAAMGMRGSSRKERDLAKAQPHTGT